MSSIIPIFASFLIGALLVAVSIPIIVRVSKAKNLVDVPNERKVNKTVIPNLGGIALFFGISVSSLLCIYQYDFKDLRYVIFAMIVMFFIGIKDDILDISARKKFMVQFFTSFVLIILGDIRFTNLHGVLGIYEINYFLSIVISSVAIVGIMNAVNLIDGIDGLASLLGLLISSFFGAFFLWWDQVPYAVMSFAVAGSLGAFYNLPLIFFVKFGKKDLTLDTYIVRLRKQNSKKWILIQNIRIIFKINLFILFILKYVSTLSGGLIKKVKNIFVLSISRNRVNC